VDVVSPPTDRVPEPLTFGLSLPNRAVLFGIPASTLLDVAARADEAGGFDSVWVGDNFLSKPRLEALVTLAAVAGRTKRVRLGTVCLASFPLRDPLQLAIEWASLDVLSGGRTILVVCSGGAASYGPQFAAELEAFRVATNERVPRLIEGIRLLRAFWGDAPVTYQGRFYSYADADPVPKPIQRRVPIAIAANPGANARQSSPELEERVLRRVARHADGWQTDGTPPEVFRERWTRIRAYAAEYGRADEVTHNSLHLMVNINDDAQQAYRESVAFLEHYYGQGTIGDATLRHWLAFGPPQAVIEKIARYVEAGCTTPILRFTTPDQHGQLERCLTDVLPVLRATFADRLASDAPHASVR
jgi:alkanesulfonate monooxygenase SsuD/methylene tetrahydromethanopterin reductase-like flavin-dependent oxidoreductase (luciferase family)